MGHVQLPQAAPVPREMLAPRAGAAPVPPVFPASSWEGGMGPFLDGPMGSGHGPWPHRPTGLHRPGCDALFYFL